MIFINTLQSSLNRKFVDKEGNVVYAQDCPLQHFKDFKFKSNQYNLSNILVEKVEDGMIVDLSKTKEATNIPVVSYLHLPVDVAEKCADSQTGLQ